MVVRRIKAMRIRPQQGTRNARRTNRGLAVTRKADRNTRSTRPPRIPAAGRSTAILARNRAADRKVADRKTTVPALVRSKVAVAGSILTTTSSNTELAAGRFGAPPFMRPAHATA